MKRNIERFPSKQMYPYLSLVERKVAEFYHNIDRRSWLVWVKMTYFHRFIRTTPGVLMEQIRTQNLVTFWKLLQYSSTSHCPLRLENHRSLNTSSVIILKSCSGSIFENHFFNFPQKTICCDVMSVIVRVNGAKEYQSRANRRKMAKFAF